MLKAVEQYLAYKHAFGNFSHYPRGVKKDGSDSLSTISLKFLEKNGWNSEAAGDGWKSTDDGDKAPQKPTLSEQELINEGLSTQQAKLCLFLVEYQEAFQDLLPGGPCIWNQANSEELTYFFDTYYILAHYVFYEQESELAQVKWAVGQMRTLLFDNVEFVRPESDDRPEYRTLRQAVIKLKTFENAKYSPGKNRHSHFGQTAKTSIENTVTAIDSKSKEVHPLESRAGSSLEI